MPKQQASNKIAQNTVYLYLRMIITLLIKLYASRVILQILGIEDFGLYNLINGVIVLLHFLTSAMNAVSQRFLSFEIGRGDVYQLNRIFSMSITTYVFITLVIVILFETIGLWFINNQLVIPPDRIDAALWVYQLSILSFVVSIVRIPYNSLIVSYENMSFFAIISILESILQLIIIYILAWIKIDILISYGFLMLIVTLLCTSIYIVYCLQKYNQSCRYHFFWDKNLFWKLLNYSGWSMIMGIANIGAQQGGNFLLNNHFGLSTNAAYGISNQVGAAIYMFSASFQTAFNPQIIKKFARGEKEDLNKFVYNVSSLSYYLMLIIAIPVLFNTETILQLWLKNVPDFAVVFCQLTIIYQLIDSFQAPLIHLIFATGNIKTYSIWLSAIIILNIPLSWYLLKIGMPPYTVLAIRVGLNFLTAIIRTIYVKSFVNFPSLDYCKKVLFRILLTTSIILLVNYMLYPFCNNGLSDLIIFTSISISITILVVYIVGINKVERAIVNKMAFSCLNKN